MLVRLHSSSRSLFFLLEFCIVFFRHLLPFLPLSTENVDFFSSLHFSLSFKFQNLQTCCAVSPAGLTPSRFDRAYNPHRTSGPSFWRQDYSVSFFFVPQIFHAISPSFSPSKTLDFPHLSAISCLHIFRLTLLLARIWKTGFYFSCRRRFSFSLVLFAFFFFLFTFFLALLYFSALFIFFRSSRSLPTLHITHHILFPFLAPGSEARNSCLYSREFYIRDFLI